MSAINLRQASENKQQSISFCQIVYDVTLQEELNILGEYAF